MGRVTPSLGASKDSADLAVLRSVEPMELVLSEVDWPPGPVCPVLGKKLRKTHALEGPGVRAS